MTYIKAKEEGFIFCLSIAFLNGAIGSRPTRAEDKSFFFYSGGKMATGKKYFWIKLKTDFMTSDKVDYLMSQPNGAEYVVLYQMLCMKCINTDGLLARRIGEVIIPFDAEKIQRDCKYFKIDTVKQAFQLFINLGMIYKEQNGYLRIAEFENMVGSETDYANQKRLQRKNKNEAKAIESGQVEDNSVDNVHIDTDIRDRVNNNIYIYTPPQENYAKTIFELWKEAELPCQKQNFATFLQTDFKNALSKISGYHSDEVIQAAKNYISVLRDPATWVTQEMTFDFFVQSPKLFKMCLPDIFRASNFLVNTMQNKNSYSGNNSKGFDKSKLNDRDALAGITEG